MFHNTPDGLPVVVAFLVYQIPANASLPAHGGSDMIQANNKKNEIKL